MIAGVLITFVLTTAAYAALAWLGLRHLAGRLKDSPEAAKALASLLQCALLGKPAAPEEVSPRADLKPEVKKAKGALVQGRRPHRVPPAPCPSCPKLPQPGDRACSRPCDD